MSEWFDQDGDKKTTLVNLLECTKLKLRKLKKLQQTLDLKELR
jgi:hypothetical protein